ncbi:hypothetical protein CARUB_v10007827mg [Capsella rubella]|uniref:Uncharacterized protein n=1 Tax=Capsella rubella TaxID=81985 RepID=R0FAU6_9BRAS|nr:hypothetical protein CARUB_v10007827mg [Capsella rubella]
MDREEPSFKRRRMDFLILPNDLVIDCLARISKLYYPVLSLVSKRFSSLIASTELYQTPTLLGRTENCLYVCLRQSLTCSGRTTLGWFTLCHKPNSSKKILVPISNHKSLSWSDGVVVVGPNIYSIGGFKPNSKHPSFNVKVMDCHSHTWREAPTMKVARVFQSTCALDGKIYVAGGQKNLDPTKWMEVFDTKTQTWEFMHIPSEEICIGNGYESIGYEGTIYVRSRDKNVTHKLHNGRWIEADLEMNDGWGSSSAYCVIEDKWTTLIGMRTWPKVSLTSAKLVGYGGNMVVLWKNVKYVGYHKETTIWCGEIAIEKREDGEIQGTPKWFDIVYTMNVNEIRLEHALVTHEI